jgi:hypothetical protein
MAIQLPLPARWAHVGTRRDPRDRLVALRDDVAGAKAAIKVVMDGVARRHGIIAWDVEEAVEGYADDMLSDMISTSSGTLSAKSKVSRRGRPKAAPHRRWTVATRGLTAHCGFGTCSEGYRSVPDRANSLSGQKSYPHRPNRSRVPRTAC